MDGRRWPTKLKARLDPEIPCSHSRVWSSLAFTSNDALGKGLPCPILNTIYNSICIATDYVSFLYGTKVKDAAMYSTHQ